SGEFVSTRANATLKRPSARALRGSAGGPPDAANGSTETAIRFESERPDPEKSAVVITGICGRMGQLLARQLHREQQVIGIDRRRFDGKPEDIIHHQIDVRRRKTQDVFRSGNIGAVVHLGVMHNLRESDRTHHSWNVVGFQKLLEYVSTYKVPKLVVLS